MRSPIERRKKNHKKMRALFLFVVLFVFSETVMCKVSRFVHLSDTHHQVEYREKTDVTQGCLRGTGSAGAFGDYWCDVPTATVASSFAAAARECPDPEFVVWSGDVIPHKFDLHGKQVTRWYLENVTAWIAKTWPNHPKTIFALGNHDNDPVNSFPPGVPEPFWVYEMVSDMWRSQLSKDAAASLAKSGFYHEEITPGLRAVVLNTNIYYQKNNGTDPTDPDPAGQLSWLRSTLAESARAGEKVLVVGHLPPGFPLFPESVGVRREANDGLVKSFDNFHENIVGALYGHHHTDTFQLIGDDARKPGSYHVAHISGSIGTWKYRNPSFRVFDFNESTFELLDYVTVYVDVREANEKGKLEWKKLYRASEQFSIPDLSPESMITALDTIAKLAPAFDGFYYRTTAMAPLPKWDEQIKNRFLCSIGCSRNADFDKCITEGF